MDPRARPCPGNSDEFKLSVELENPNCAANVTISDGSGSNESFAFPAPGDSSSHAFRLSSPDECKVARIQREAHAGFTGHAERGLCTVQFLTVSMGPQRPLGSLNEPPQPCLTTTALCR